MDRKTFLKTAGAGAGYMLTPSVITSCVNDGISSSDLYQNSLQLPGGLDSDILQAAPSNLMIAGKYSIDGLRFNESLPGPTIRKRRGEHFQVQFQNDIGQESIIHWHGMIVPPEMDGHPKDVISDGSYSYDFQINQRAGTYWY
ncbi:MAG: multicopper oxidase domain-containing protein, partial [Candidatus Halalkalibacterium sp. M3_1C_030]